MTTYYQIAPYVIGVAGDGFTEIVCQEHALDFAKEHGLTWDSSLGYTEERPDQIYAYADCYGEIESDTPQSCTACEMDGKHTTWLGVTLTTHGEEYALENGFPAKVLKFYGLESKIVCAECGVVTEDSRGDFCKDCDKQGGN